LILPDQADKEIEPAWFEEAENIRVADAFVVDVMLNGNGQTYATLRSYAATITLEGIPVSTIWKGSCSASKHFVKTMCRIVSS
jgi:hypothetical protein